MSGYPERRLRRLRHGEGIRALIRETTLTRDDFLCPVFVVEDPAAAGPVASLPGVERHSLDSLSREVEAISSAGLRGLLLFGIPGRKDANAATALGEDSIAARAVRRVKELNPDLVIVTDVCLCSYTTHGHCGVMHGTGTARTGSTAADAGVDNDATLVVLQRMAAAHGRAGADFVAPSGMMDGMVRAIRSALDAEGLRQTGILSYAVKYASSFYGPFRDAADSAPEFGDRRGYQMDPSNAREALAEARLDFEEGADMLMVKPALPYLDIIQRVRAALPEAPLAAYQVSGEYSMIKAASARGWLDERRAALEALTAIKRAGADIVITYYARQAAAWLNA